MSKVTQPKAEERRRLAEEPKAAIGTSDLPEVIDWTGAERGRFYRPIKQQVTRRIDADVLAWFKARGDKYQTRIDAALRESIEHHG